MTLRTFLVWYRAAFGREAAPPLVREDAPLCWACRYRRESVRWDEDIGKALCDACWAATPIPAVGRNAGASRRR